MLFHIKLRLAPLALCLFLATTPLHGQEAEKKNPAPNAAAQAEATKLLKEVYGDEIAAAKTSSQKQAFAIRLLNKAASTQDDLNSKYVLLKACKNLAVQALDAETAMAAVDRMADTFDVDIVALKSDVLNGLAQKSHLASEHAALTQLVLALMDQAIAGDKFDEAANLGTLVMQEARASKSPQLLRQARMREADVQQKAKAFEEQKAALTTLEKKPDDPQANLVAGKYLCFTKNNWEKGVPMLALCGDDELKTIAMTDLKGPTTPAEQLKLADAWWALAEKEKAPAKKPLESRARHWYRQALPGLTGLMKEKVDRRIAEEIEEPMPLTENSPVRGHPPIAIAPFNEKKAKQYQTTWAKYLHVPVVQINSVGMRLVLIPPGEFQMGSPRELKDDQRLQGLSRNGSPMQKITQEQNEYSEEPPHRIRLTKPYWMALTAVTQEEYQRVMGDNPSHFGGNANNPVEHVSWNQAADFCTRLSDLPAEKAAKRRYVLPTEAQWEQACRAGTTTRWYSGDDVAGLREVAWFTTNSDNHPHAVGQKRPNAWGLYDMHGNIWQWCQDLYDKDYYAKSQTDDPAGSSEGTRRIYRGGAYGGASCRSALRYSNSAGWQDWNLGFRVSAVVTEKSSK